MFGDSLYAPTHTTECPLTIPQNPLQTWSVKYLPTFDQILYDTVTRFIYPHTSTLIDAPRTNKRNEQITGQANNTRVATLTFFCLFPTISASLTPGGQARLSSMESESRIVGVDDGVVRSIIYHCLRAETWMPPCARNDFLHFFIHNSVAFGRQMKTVAAGGKGNKEWMGEVRGSNICVSPSGGANQQKMT